jgi:DnaJ-class molecular chaperone
MLQKDYYRTLGVGADATEEEIKRAYRVLAMTYHPDRNKDDPQSTEKLKEINEAYGILGNARRKAAYDHVIAPRPVKDNGSAKKDFLFSHLDAFLRGAAMTEGSGLGPFGCRKAGFGRRGCRKGCRRGGE